MNENFQDGRNPQDKGDSRRHGIPKKATITQLKKIRSSKTSSPRKKQLAHWQINMRQGKNKTNEEATTTAAIPNPIDTAQGPKAREISVTDKRYKKNKLPVLLKRFRRYIDSDG